MGSGGYGNKIKRYSGFAVVLCLLLLASCAKDGVQVPQALSSYNLSAYANNEFVTFTASATNYGDTVLDIYGTWVTNIGQTYNLDLLNLKINKGNVVGSYSLDPVSEGQYYSYTSGTNPPNYIFYYTTNWWNEGTVKITSYDNINNTITGTFSFYAANSGQNSININNGVFNRIPVH